MKIFSSFVVLGALVIHSSSAFVVGTNGCHQRGVGGLTSSSSISMGLFDFFSEEAKQKRENQKRKEREEQERLQKAIMERRKNPELMEEYERKVAIRRELRMAGNDEAAAQVVMYENVESKTLLDGTVGMSQ